MYTLNTVMQGVIDTEIDILQKRDSVHTYGGQNW